MLQVAEPLDTAPDLVEALPFSTRSGAPMRTSAPLADLDRKPRVGE